MENDALLRRAEELMARAERSWTVAGTTFLTPAEQTELARAIPAGTPHVFCGGPGDCERRALFFLPPGDTPEDFDPAPWLCAVEIRAGFGQPEHRDYLGAVLALGIRREWVGDIRVVGDTAHLFCLPSVVGHLTASLDHVGRWGVRVRQVPLDAVPVPEAKRRPVTFTVQSVRLDAVLAGMFRLSRTAAAEAIRQGLVQQNYLVQLKVDAPVAPGDVLSLRGKGKGQLTDLGGSSRKGRQFLTAEIYE